ncbi:MAG: hypothetical protein HC772_07435 [Leptolyngbyaceae cyanobacterium CRU_2_3]|nr:hypothetical protein [Leptolyngbyaceae cyanobacterium CRU_2_3]
MIVTGILGVSHAHAESLDACISQVAQRVKTYPTSPDQKPAQVNFSINGKLFRVVAGSDSVELLRGEDETRLSSVSAWQYDTSIRSLVLGKDDWLWIDGSEIDYMSKLDRSGSTPKLGLPVALPKLCRTPYPLLLDFLFGCDRAQGVYSTTLDRAFIKGHQVTLLGQPDLISYEIIAGEAKRLPAKLNDNRFIADLPKLNGVLLRGAAGEALFYDGAVFTNLLAGLDSEGLAVRSDPTHWRLESKFTERTFLTNLGSSGDDMPFLLELKAGPRLIPISIPYEIANKPFPRVKLFKLPNDSRPWVVSDHSILAEVAGDLRTVARVPAPSSIKTGFAWQESDGTISFTVNNGSAGADIQYMLAPTSLTRPCKTPLNTDKPILLVKP